MHVSAGYFTFNLGFNAVACTCVTCYLILSAQYTFELEK